jgi:hypothetical protein
MPYDRRKDGRNIFSSYTCDFCGQSYKAIPSIAYATPRNAIVTVCGNCVDTARTTPDYKNFKLNERIKEDKKVGKITVRILAR